MSSLLPVSIRLATESDIPAILSLLLTSFRQLPLFSILYSPLYEDKSAAHDTLFFWGRRVLLDLLGEGTEIIVAEVSREQCPAAESVTPPTAKEPHEGERDEIKDESWQMLDWCVTKARLSQVSTKDPQNVIVGFAIWEFRKGTGVAQSPRNAQCKNSTWLDRIRVSLITCEQYLWKRFYTRRDQDHGRYTAYLAAEEELSTNFYADNCYYLDNLCVDFRCQRMGIGQRLVAWGVDRARGNRLPIQTEASPKGRSLYLKVGFQQIGTWTISIPHYDQELVEMPVMRLQTT